jgi:ATP-dependent exoDNAse (exonuclease V) alpha subunit
MAIYYLNVKTFGRSAGGRATSAAAYRAGERIVDERSGRVFDHSQRTDVMHNEIVLPSTLVAADMSWLHDRSVLWNAAEHAEPRKNARVAREYLVALPHEMTPAQRLKLVQGFSQELADLHGFAVDIAIHAPRPYNDPRNYHAHLLTTTREVLPTGLGAKTDLDISDSERRRRGLGSSLKELLAVRERWATLTNEALRQTNVRARVDHRSLQAQGIDREPIPQIPMAARRTEEQGQRSDVADAIRAAYRARVQARLERGAGRMTGVQDTSGLEDMQRRARHSWLQVRRAQLAHTSLATNDPADAQERIDPLKEYERGRTGGDDDLAM